MKSKIIIITILLLLVIGVAGFILRAKTPGADIINTGKPMPVKDQATLLESLAAPTGQLSTSTKEQVDVLHKLSAPSMTASSTPSPTVDEQTRILESLQKK